MLEEILCAGPLLGRRGDASLESRCLSEAKWEDEEEKHSRKMEHSPVAPGKSGFYARG